MMRRIWIGLTILCPWISGAATGDISSVVILTNGWQAEVTIQGLADGGTYSFGMGPNNTPETGSPTVTLQVTSMSFTTNGEPSVISRTVWGTHSIAKPWPENADNEERVEGGTVTVRIALSHQVFRRDSNVVATLTTGFYNHAGNPSLPVSGMAVANQSEVEYQRPAAAWSEPGWQMATGEVFRVSAVAFHHGARDGRQVRMVRFTATEGETTASVDVTGTVVDFTRGDAVPVVEFVGYLPTAPFSQGATLAVNFKAFPFIGDDAAITDTADGFNTGLTPNYAPQTWVVDKAGTYGRTVALVSTGGNDSTGVTVPLASYNPASPPAAFATIARAAAAIATNNNAQFSRNDVGGGVVFLASGSHNWTGGSQAYGSTPQTWITIRPAPGVSRDQAVISGASGNADISDRVKLEGVKITSTATTFNGIEALWLDGCEIDSESGTSVFNQNTLWYLTRNTITRSAQGIRSVNLANTSPAIVRGNVIRNLASGSAGTIHAYTFIGNYSTFTNFGIGNIITGQTAPIPQMPIVAFNKAFHINRPTSTAVTYSKHVQIIAPAMVQNVFEKSHANTGAMSFMFSEGGNFADVRGFVLDHNAWLGERSGFFYNWEQSWGFFENITVRNNMISVYGGKTDDTPPQATTNTLNWATIYGVNWSGNIDGAIAGLSAAGGFRNRFWGLNGIQTGGTHPYDYFGFRLNRATDGTTTTAGSGDYRLRLDSPARGLAREWVLSHDIEGAPRNAGEVTAGPYGSRNYYHVALHGNDFTGNGSWAFPWRTVQKGVDTATNANDTILVWPGNYGENVVTKASGSSGNPITLKGAGGGESIVRTLRVNQHQWIAVEDMTFHGAQNSFGQHIRVENQSHNLVVRRCTVRDTLLMIRDDWHFDHTDNSISSPSGSDWAAAGFVEGGRIYSGAMSIEPETYANHDTAWTISSIDGNKAFVTPTMLTETNNSAWAPIFAGVGHPGFNGIEFIISGGTAATNALLEENEFRNIYGSPFVLRGNAVVRNNRSYNTYSRASIHPHGDNLLIEGNLWMNSTNWINYDYAENFEIPHAAGPNWYDYRQGHVHTVIPGTNVVIRRNWWQGISQPVAQISETATSRDWLWEQNVWVGMMEHMGNGVDFTTIRSNLFYRVSYDERRHWALSVGGNTEFTPVTDMWIVHNAFIDVGSHSNTNAEGYYNLVNAHNSGAFSNFVASAETMGWHGKAGFTEAGGINGGDPLLRNPQDPLGPDGLPFTEDDGLRPLPHSPLARHGIGPLQALTVVPGRPIAHFSIYPERTGWKDALGTNFNPAWKALKPYQRPGPVRPWDTFESVGEVPARIMLDARGSISGSWSTNHWMGITNFVWDLGNGAVISTRWPTNLHTFVTPGEHTITLTTHNNLGESDTVARKFRVLPQSSYPYPILHVATTGSNTTGDGSYANPWATIGKAHTNVVAGGIIAVHPGAYTEYLDLNRNIALETNRVSITGYGASVGGFQVRNPNWTIEGFTITGTNSITGTGLYIYHKAHRPWSINNRFRDFGVALHGAFRAVATGDPHPTNGTLNGWIFGNSFTNIRGPQIQIENGKDWIIRNTIAVDSWGEGDFIRPYGQGFLIEDGYVSNLSNGGTEGHPDFIQLAAQDTAQRWFRDVEIRNFLIVGNPLGGSSDAAMGQIQSEHDGDVRWTNAPVFINTIFHHVRAGISDSSDGMAFYNCAWHLSPRVVGHVNYGGGSRGSSYNARFWNNIFNGAGLTDAVTTGWYYDGQDGEQAYNSTTVADRNFVAGITGVPKQQAPPNASNRFRSIGNDANGINGGSPGWIDPANGDFRLREDSVLRGAGEPPPSHYYPFDFFGRPRDPENWDIGPIAYAGTFGAEGETPPPPPPPPPTGLGRGVVGTISAGQVTYTP